SPVPSYVFILLGIRVFRELSKLRIRGVNGFTSSHVYGLVKSSSVGGGGWNLFASAANISLGVLVRGVNRLDPPPSLEWPRKSGLLSMCFFDWSCGFQDMWPFFLLAAVASPRMKAVVAIIISSIVLGTCSFKRFVNSGLFIPCMNPKIHMHSGAPFMRPVSTLNHSIKSSRVSPSRCLML
nr:hypothetical protein [Tanacetum cinerariifolium]